MEPKRTRDVSLITDHTLTFSSVGFVGIVVAAAAAGGAVVVRLGLASHLTLIAATRGIFGCCCECYYYYYYYCYYYSGEPVPLRCCVALVVAIIICQSAQQ